jgi:hypothetical protein
VATTGDVITYRVSVDHDEAYEIEVPEPGAEIAGFRIIDLGREEPRRVRGRMVEERWYKLRADLVGSYVLPPVTVGFRSKSEEEGSGDATAVTEQLFESVETSAIFIEVESVLPAEGGAEDILDLKPLRRVRRLPPWPWIGGAVAALLLVVGSVLWYLWRRRRRPGPPPEPAHLLAFQALGALRGTDFENPQAVRRFHFAISEIVRGYVEGRFGLNATDLTTEEIFTDLGGVADLDAGDGDTLHRFLLATDLVKFAEHTPSKSEIEQTYESALGFVEATKPVPTVEAVAT